MTPTYWGGVPASRMGMGMVEGAVHDVPELGLSCLSAAATAHWGRTRKRGIFQSIIDVNNL